MPVLLHNQYGMFRLKLMSHLDYEQSRFREEERNSHVTLKVTLASLLVLRSSPRFSRKRETARSLMFTYATYLIMK